MIIGIAGGTGSGKTTVARRIMAAVGPERVTLVQQDAYYRDLSHLALAERAQVNFDHPAAMDTELLVAHLERLAAGQSIDRPVYDFVTHTRRPETERVSARPVVILEGILILAEPRLRALQDLRVFVDTDPDVRFIRRLQRDVQERGRTLESVIDQYLTTVRPMHLEFVEPSKRYAHVILPEGGFNEVGLGLIVEKVRAFVEVSGERVIRDT
jgi:uridine kinase